MQTNHIVLLNNLLKEEIEKYKNLNTDEIKKVLHISGNAKNLNSVIVQKLIKSSINYLKINELLNKCSFIIKTINLEWNNGLKESISLKVFKYCDLVEEEWEKSILRSYFSDNIFIFFVFKKNFKTSTLQNVVVWQMPSSILDGGVRDVWLQTKELLLNGKVINYTDKNNRDVTFFPSASETKYIHVRPHAQNKLDTLPLPIPDKETGKADFVKHSFWLNSKFIKKVIVDGQYYE